jgi:hypothetical protein
MRWPCVHNARPASTLRSQGPVLARIVSLENIKVQVQRHCARPVPSIRLQQSRVQHWGLVFVAPVSPAPGCRARFRVLPVFSGRAVSRGRSAVLFGRQERVMEGALLVRLMGITDLIFLQNITSMLG